MEHLTSQKDYYWYDTEDGEDMLKKLNFASKFALIIGPPLAALDQATRANQTLRGYGIRYLMYTVPALGMAGMFTLTTQMLCKHVPQLEPKISYAIGGFAAGTVVGALKRSVFLGCVTGVYLSVIGLGIRSLHEGNDETLYGNLEQSLINDDEHMSVVYFKPKPSNLPPPAARPAFGPPPLF